MRELAKQERGDARQTLRGAERELKRMMSLCVQAERRVAEAQHEAGRRTKEMLEVLHRASRLRLEIGQLRQAVEGATSLLDRSCDGT